MDNNQNSQISRKFIFNKPILTINTNFLKENHISLNELKKYFPKYILYPTIMYYSYSKIFFIRTIKFILELLVKFFLKPQKSRIGFLDLKEVNEVYKKEAKTYNKKHHLTTRGMDLIWRRNIGWFIARTTRGKNELISILDLCTGTGLTIQEVCKIFEEWEIKAKIVGLDYNLEMLTMAKSNMHMKGDCIINYVRGDAMNLIKKNSDSDEELVKFENNTFDFVIQMFGIGGISDPLKVFDGILQILKAGGQFFLIDMHKPIPHLSGEWPLFLKWLQFSHLEIFIYEQSTIPLVLNRLWGWRDTTLCFYLLPLITYEDKYNNFWGFDIVYFEQESQRWWFALPFMPIAKIIVSKIQITKDEAEKRNIILKSCIYSL